MPIAAGTTNNGLTGPLHKEVVFRLRRAKTITSRYPGMSKVGQPQAKKVTALLKGAHYYAQLMKKKNGGSVPAQYARQ